MAVGRPTPEIGRPSAGFDALIDWFEEVSHRLVLLEEYPLDELRAWVQTVEAAVALHGRVEGPLLAALRWRSVEDAAFARVVAADHEWFRTSSEQLRWFLSVVEKEDHGGHRQALGQFGRLYAESLRRHRADERELVRRASGSPPVGGPRRAANGN